MARLLGAVLLLGALAGGGCWLLGAREASRRASAFRDAARDAQPVAELIAPTGAGPARRPSFVVIVADDLGYGDLESHGGRAIRTPHLDALAREGVRFTEFYASASICSPSRAGLLTGRYPVRTGISYIIFASEISLAHRVNLALSRFGTRLGLSDFHDSVVSGLPPSEITLAEALRVGGYATGMVGKWHLGDFSHDRAHLPTRHGFDAFEGLPHSNDEFPVSYWRGEEPLRADVGLDQEQLTRDLTAAAVRFVEVHAGEPFFLYVAQKDVHLPFFPSEAFRGRSSAGLYGDAAEELDWSVGEILKALEARGLRESTLVLFTSDNGPWFDGSSGGLRGGKGMPFEGGQRVPLIASWPGTLPAGAQVDAPAMNIDLFPTLLALAGLGLPADRVVDGRDLSGLLLRRERESPHEALLFFHDDAIEGVRSGPWKYYRAVHRFRWPVPLDAPSTLAGRTAAGHRYTDAASGRTAGLLQAFPLLYDLRTDPGESYDVSDRHPDVTGRLRGLVEAFERDLAANPRGWK
jgi:uncharacterized sulfatase